MSEDSTSGSDHPAETPFDLERLQLLMELMEKHGVTEVSLRNKGELWRLRRGPDPASLVSMPAYGPPQPSLPSGPSESQAAAPAKTGEPPEATGTLIKSPTVGTFYSSPTPDDPPFVTVGSKIQPDTTVCIVEAMKVFNQIPAEVSGTITAVLVNNGDSVEYDQPLFRVAPG